jgi:hypothetical protein
VVLFLHEGAVLMYGSGETAQLTEDESYRRCAIEGGTCLSSGVAQRIVGDMQAVMKRLVAHFSQHPEQVQLLSDKYKVAYGDLLQEVGAGGDIDQVLTLERLMEPGAIMKATNERMLSITPPWLRKDPPEDCANVVQMGVPRLVGGRF